MRLLDRNAIVTGPGAPSGGPLLPYDGITVTGYPIVIVSRGEVIVEEGCFVGQPGWDRFIERGSQSAKGHLYATP